MLGKQGWRFLSKLDSLVTRVYKAQYFNKDGFLKAEIDYNPNFIWRSIWEAKELIKAGVRWRIGSGTQVQIADQPWLLDEQNPFITTVADTITGNTVASLMCTDKKEWDHDVIRDIFNDRDQVCILSIPL